MKHIIMTAMLALFSTGAHALPATTNSGYVACLTEQWLSDMVAFVGAQDEASFAAYIEAQRCLILREGLTVTVTKSPGMFGGRAEFVFRGQRFWTVREGLDYQAR